MAINKIEHIGIAVRDLESSEKLFQQLLGAPSYKREIVESVISHIIDNYVRATKG